MLCLNHPWSVRRSKQAGRRSHARPSPVGARARACMFPQPHSLVAALVQEKIQFIQFTVAKLARPSHYGGIVMKRVTGPSKERPPRRLMNTAFA